MTTPLLLPSVAVLALLAAGCAELRWQKPGAAQATLEQDLERCRQEAHVRAERETVPSLALTPVLGTDQQGRPIVIQSHQRDAERLLAQQDLTRSCMRAKGYELVPAEKR
jgi:hypothetical protein